MDKKFLIGKLKEKKLRVTPQRLAILEAVNELKNHPTADNIIEFIKENHPNIATGTVYKVLDTLYENKLINKVKTDKDIMRYDAIVEHHHHLYSSDSEKIEDYFNEDLNKLLSDYFEVNKISNFKIENIKLQIIGKFKKNINVAFQITFCAIEVKTADRETIMIPDNPGVNRFADNSIHTGKGADINNAIRAFIVKIKRATHI